MSLKTKTICYYTLCAALIGCFLTTPAYAATKVRMRQVIRPLPCGVDHITDIDGLDYYFAPRECGRLVVVPSNNLTSEGESSMALQGGIGMYLDPQKANTAADAYLLVVNKNIVYKFRLAGESQIVPERTMEVLGVDTVAHTVQLRFTPGDKLVTLHLGQRVRVDVAFDNSPDLDITFSSITSDNKVVLRVWFPGQDLALQKGVVHSTKDTFVAAGVIIIALGLQLSTAPLIRKRTKKIWNNERHWHTVE